MKVKKKKSDLVGKKYSGRVCQNIMGRGTIFFTHSRYELKKASCVSISIPSASPSAWNGIGTQWEMQWQQYVGWIGCWVTGARVTS